MPRFRLLLKVILVSVVIIGGALFVREKNINLLASLERVSQKVFGQNVFGPFLFSEKSEKSKEPDKEFYITFEDSSDNELPELSSSPKPQEGSKLTSFQEKIDDIAEKIDVLSQLTADYLKENENVK